jgi:LysM repeat protein
MERLARLLPAGVILVAALLLAVAAPRVTAQPDQAIQMINLVNQYRAARGLGTLQIHPALMTAAQTHVDWMVATGNYGHTGEGGTQPWQRAKAAGYPTAGWYVYENWTGGSTPQEALDWWDNSPVHHQTLNLQSFDHIGVGYASNGRRGIYVLMVAQPSLPEGESGSSDVGNASEAAGPAEETGPPPPTPYYVEPIVQAEPREDGTIMHTIGQGQTAWDIAVVYDVDLDEMLAINGLERPVILFPGDEIIVKLGPDATPPPREPTTHVVQDGESAWTIAAIHGITLDELLIANGLERPAILQPGQTVIVPPPTTPTPTPTP